MISLLKHMFVFIVLIWACLIFWGPKIDKTCVEGVLSSEQAGVINSLPWGKCPKYRDGYCRAEEGDRIVVGGCSKLSRKIFLQDGLKTFRKQWKKWGTSTW